MAEQILKTKTIDLTPYQKYETKSLPAVSAFSSTSLEGVMKSVYNVNSKVNGVCNEIISENTPLKVKLVRVLQTIGAYMKIGQIPSPIEVKDIFETYFDEVRGIAMKLRDYTAEAQSKASSLENHLIDHYDQMTALDSEFNESYGDAQNIHKDLKALESKGITSRPRPGHEQEAKQLLQLGIYFDNAKSKARIAKQGYLIRSKAVTIVEFYKNIVKEFADSGEMACNDIEFIVDELRPLVAIVDDADKFGKNMERANEIITKLGSYMGQMTNVIQGYQGLIGKARIHGGNLISSQVQNSLERKADELSTRRSEIRENELGELGLGMTYESTKS